MNQQDIDRDRALSIYTNRIKRFIQAGKNRRSFRQDKLCHTDKWYNKCGDLDDLLVKGITTAMESSLHVFKSRKENMVMTGWTFEGTGLTTVLEDSFGKVRFKFARKKERGLRLTVWVISLSPSFLYVVLVDKLEKRIQSTLPLSLSLPLTLPLTLPLSLPLSPARPP